MRSTLGSTGPALNQHREARAASSFTRRWGRNPKCGKRDYADFRQKGPDDEEAGAEQFGRERSDGEATSIAHVARDRVTT